MKHKTTTNHNTNVIMKFDNLAYISRPLSQWVKLSYFYSKLNKYITTVTKGYKIDLVLFYQISRTQQKKRHSNRMIRAPRNGPQRCAPQQLPCIKMALAWLSFSINILWISSPWPQEGMVYIDLKLITISQLSPNIWPKKGPNIPQKWAKISNNMHKIIKKSICLSIKTTFTIIFGLSPPI